MTYGDYPDLSSVQKILVIKLRQLGDVLLTTPVLSALKNRFPNAEVDLYVYTESIPLIKSHLALHQCIGYDRAWKKLPLLKRLIQEAKVLWKLRKRGYDLVINLTEGDRGAIAAQISKAPIRVGVDPKGSGLFGKKNLYTHTVKSCPTLRHTVERNLDALRRIGLFPTQEERELFLSVPQEIVARIRSQVPASFLLIHPTSRWRFKCWPVEKMRAVAETLLARGISLVFTSGPDKEEVAMVGDICGGLPVTNLAGKISLSELTALVSLSDQLLCVDSLPFHIASALKKPVVVLFGPTSDITWGPWRNPHATVLTQAFSCRPCYQDGCGGSKVSDCLVSLPVSQVLEALHVQTLKRNSPQRAQSTQRKNK
jgi:heptosyltransferase-3